MKCKSPFGTSQASYSQPWYIQALPLRSEPLALQVNNSRTRLASRHDAARTKLRRTASSQSSSLLPRSTSLVTCRAAPGSTAESPQELRSSSNHEDSPLHGLLVWLVNNGVTGIGMPNSKVALYEDTDGERGVVAVEDISAGQQLVRVPLRLAITDVMDEQQQSQLVGQGRLWQDRLVAKLLHEVQQGRQSPWYPYIRALPKSVPSALESFTLTEAQEVQLPAVVRDIQHHADKIAASWQACRPDAISGADLATYRWAHSCVMSRTFGNAAPGGGIGVRMMVPLIDMLNHAGDETSSGLLSDTAVPQDNVRWDIISPQNSPSSIWEMVLSTTQDISAGSQLLLSYFEGNNDEFLLHYGFVPASNPHDQMKLFGSLSEALEHLWWQQQAQGDADAARLAPLYQQALDAGLAALQQEVAAAAAGSGDDSSSWGRLLDALEPIQVASGGRVSGSLIAALEVLHQGDMVAVEAAVAALAWQQLQALPTSLLYDLALLAADAVQIGDQEAVQMYHRLLRHYTKALVPQYLPELADHLAAAAAADASSSSTSSSNSSSSSRASSTSSKKTRKAVPGPALLADVTAADAEQQTAVAGAVGLAVSQIPIDQLVKLLMVHHTVMISENGKSHDRQSDGVSSSSANGQQPSEVHDEVPSLNVSNAVRTAVKFRVSKKMLLVDVILAARTPLVVVQQQQQAAAAAAALKAGYTASGVGASGELPWQQ